MDAFISHSSVDRSAAAKVEERLQAQGLSVWLDRSSIRLGVLLRDELQAAIRDARVLVLLWSKAAAASRWVSAELVTAFHLDRFIVPCTLDDTPLPWFLRNSIHLSIAPRRKDWVEPLGRAVAGSPASANPVPPLLASRSREQQETIDVIARGQLEVTNRLGTRDVAEAEGVQRLLDDATAAALRAWPLDTMILALAGYHRKNAYLLKHWEAVQAGQPPDDPLLAQSEGCFFASLFVDPNDHGALNGLGSTLILARDLDVAEFFIRRAIALAERQGIDYPAARQDLAMLEARKARR